MSKSISGSRYTLNIENLNLLDLNVRALTASTDITGSYLTASRVVATDVNKKLVSSDITTTELNYLDGVSSAIQTQLNAKQATITAGTNLSFDGATLNATSSSSTITANRLAVSNGSGVIIASAVTDTEAGYLDGVSSAIQTQINAKQATITDGSLTIARTSGLQTALDAKQATIGNSLSTSNTFTLVVGSLSPKTTTFENDGDFISGGNVTDAAGNVLSAKQGTIGDGDLTIARTSGLQTALDAKQATITDGSLTIARTSGLQTALDAKQATITDGSLTIARTSGLQTALDAKQATISSSNRVNATNLASGIVTNTELNQLHDINTDTTVQTQIDTKQTTITATTKIPKPLYVNTSQSLSSPMNDLSKISNTVVCLINVDGTIPQSANQTTTAGYYIDCFSAPNFRTINELKNTGIVDSSVFTIVAPTYTTATTVSAHTGTAARFGIKILSAGLYRANYITSIENESVNNRVSIHLYFRVLFTDSGGTERAELLHSSLADEYTRDDQFGQYATVCGTAYFEITNDMATDENGCFLKLNLFCKEGTGESFDTNPNGLIPKRGLIEMEKIAELAS